MLLYQGWVGVVTLGAGSLGEAQAALQGLRNREGREGGGRDSQEAVWTGCSWRLSVREQTKTRCRVLTGDGGGTSVGKKLKPVWDVKG